MAKSGICRLCGTKTDRLTKDHIQPQCAYNEKRRAYVAMESIPFANSSNEVVSGPFVRNIYREIQPNRPVFGGIYKYTQCAACNGFLGQFYDQRFGNWCHEALGLLKPGKLIIIQKAYTQTCRYPLSILKRIVAMFFSVNGDRFAGCQQDLAAFVRDPRSKNMPPRFRFFAAYNVNDIVSHIPLQFKMNARSGQVIHISQIGHAPFVYAMTIDSNCPDSRLTDITHFARFGYDDEANTDVAFRLVPTNSPCAGDYRTAGKVIPDDVVVLMTGLPRSYYRITDRII